MKARQANKGSDDGDSKLREHVDELLVFDVGSISSDHLYLHEAWLVAISNTLNQVAIVSINTDRLGFKSAKEVNDLETLEFTIGFAANSETPKLYLNSMG